MDLSSIPMPEGPGSEGGGGEEGAGEGAGEGWRGAVAEAPGPTSGAASFWGGPGAQAPSLPDEGANPSAWQKAQEALSKVAPSPTKPPAHEGQPASLGGIQSQMLQFYPWMSNLSSNAALPGTSGSGGWNNWQTGGGYGQGSQPYGGGWGGQQPWAGQGQGQGQGFYSGWGQPTWQQQRPSAPMTSASPMGNPFDGARRAMPPVANPASGSRGSKDMAAGLPPPGLVVPTLASQPPSSQQMSRGRGRGGFFRGGGPRLGGGGGGPGPGGTGGNTTPLGPRPGGPAASADGTKKTGMPPGMTAYIERAYMAVDGESDKNKVEMALKQKLMPLLQSGEAWEVRWETEPLPTDAGFEGGFNQKRGPSGWAPMSLMNAAPLLSPRGQGRGRGSSGVRGRNVFGGGGGRGPWDSSSDSDSDDKARRSRRSPKRRRSRSPLAPRHKRFESPPPREPPFAFGKEKPARGGKAGKRGARGGKAGKGGAKRWELDGETEESRRRRAERFRPAPRSIASRLDIDDILSLDFGTSTEPFLSQGPVVGLSEEVEKPFFRLTTAADPLDVRPPGVLRRALDNVKARWKRERNYVYCQSQLRSIRQDLTVQRVRDAFTVEAYETHARIALENGDREEFNQCQTQLKTLYVDLPSSPNRLEFTAYRLLYYISMENDLDVTRLLAELSSGEKRDSVVAFALGVRRSWALRLHQRLLAAHRRAPRMAAYVMDLFVERERREALKRLFKAYRPSVPVDHVLDVLGFADDREAGTEFLVSVGVLEEDGPHPASIDTRQAFAL